jgi:branched-chain amino acid transport system ATP-binding protein
MLELDGVDAFYGRAQVLFGLSLSVRQGEVVALLGRNGAGKSTTLKAILGLGVRVEGQIRFEGRSIVGLATGSIARLGLGYVPEDRRIFTSLTVAENLEVGRRPPHRGSFPWTLPRVLDLFPNLAEMLKRPAGQISGGEQQMLAIARTLMGNPKLMMLDEPSEGLAPRIVDNLAAALETMKREGLTLLLAEQNLRFALGIADRIAVLERGRVTCEGAATTLLTDEGLPPGLAI